jgi:hypothetical protein
VSADALKLVNIARICLFMIATSLYHSQLFAAASLKDRRNALKAMLVEHWEYTLQDDPITASEIGDKRWNAKLPDLSLSAWNKRREMAETFVAFSIKNDFNFDAG